MKKTKLEQEKTIKIILDSALNLFDEKGYEKVSLDEIAKKSGVTRGAIYHNFSGKSDILKRIISFYDKELNGKIEENFSEEKESLENFFDFFDIYFSQLNINSKLEKLLFFTTFSGEEKKYIDKINEKQQKELEKYFIYLFKKGISEGNFPQNINLKNNSKILYYNFIGMLYQFFNEKTLFSDKTFYKKNLEIFFNGIIK